MSTYDIHTAEVQEMLRHASISRKSMLTSEQVFNCYRTLDRGYEDLSPEAVRQAIMGGKPIVGDQPPDEWATKQLDQGTGCTCPDCEGKIIVNFDALDEQELMTCPYCLAASELPEEPE